MRLRFPVLSLAVALLAWPVGAQTTLQSDPDPSYGGRVQDSPVPSRRSTPRPADTTGQGAGGPAGDRTETAATGPADDTSRVTSPDDATIETRTLPVLRRSDERPPEEDDAGGRIKAAPDPDAGSEDREDERFVRVPEGKTYEIEEPTGAPLPTPETQLQRGATLRQLDKMTGQIVTFDIAVGQALSVARLTVQLDACRSPGDNDTHGTMAHLKIWDTKLADADAVFAGWMFAESPALSALDHPRYDLWVINCTTVSAEASAGNE